MNRRNAMKMAAGALIAGGGGLVALTTAFKPECRPEEAPGKLEYKNTGSDWAYYPLDPSITAELSYKNYESGSCMYATFKSIMMQLAEKYGEPYKSFPLHMMKYGHGGIAGFGTICGALNGAAAIIGLFVADKAIQDSLITGLFRWYESKALPEYSPQTPVLDFTPPSSISHSILCHASTTNWAKKAGYKINSDQRKERCRRLTSDIASRLAVVLNDYTANTYVTDGHDNEIVRTCMTCHGDTGKLGNTSGKMGCTSCHTESAGHKIFADIHYKVMKP